jgi:LacI family transcriptional regulator
MIKKAKSTISDVARLAGVSKKTVSRVINNSPKVRADTRETVLRVIRKLNYVPSPQARGLAARRSFLLGLIYDNPDPLYIDAIQRGILSVCGPAGYELVVHPCDISELDHVAKAIRDAGCHYVRLAAAVIDDDRHIVVSNERAAVRELTEYLIELGHRRIGFISGPENYLSTRERFAGFLEAHRQNNLSFDANLKIEGNYDFKSGKSCAETLLSMDNPPTSIFAGNDDMASGAIHAAFELGIAVPGGLSIAGFDDSRLASLILPTLTTIKRPVTHMSSLAATKLIAAIDHTENSDTPTDVVVVPEVIVRNSTGSVAKA